MSRLTINIRPCGYITLLTTDGAWVGPGLGNFRNVAKAVVWALENGYEVAEQIVYVPIHS